MPSKLSRSKKILSAALAALLLAGAAAPRAAAYSQSGPLKVATAADVNRMGADFVDGPWSSWTAGDTRYWLSSDNWGKYHHLCAGPVDQPVTDVVYAKKTTARTFTNAAAFDLGRKIRGEDYCVNMPWFMNIYKDSGGGLLAFLHIENYQEIRRPGCGILQPAYDWMRRIFYPLPRICNAGAPDETQALGLAYSTDNGRTFRFLGYIADRGPGNIQGAPYLIKDGYFYVYYNKANTNVARAPVDEVLAAAKNGAVTEWKAFYAGAWEEPALGGKASQLNLFGISHTQAAYSTYDGKYYMALTMMNWGEGDTWVKLYQSSDCVNWEYYQTVVLDPNDKYGVKAMGWQYSFIADAGAQENATVGRKFYVYCADYYDSAARLTDVYRWTIDLAE